MGNLVAHLPENAEALVDWALSHAPIKAGPRRSKHKKRVLHRIQLKQQRHRDKIAEVRAARDRRREKNLRVLREEQEIKRGAVAERRKMEDRWRSMGLLRSAAAQ